MFTGIFELEMDKEGILHTDKKVKSYFDSFKNPVGYIIDDPRGIRISEFTEQLKYASSIKVIKHKVAIPQELTEGLSCILPEIIICIGMGDCLELFRKEVWTNHISSR